MGKRVICNACFKALPACICATIKSLDNLYCLHILQDPSEEKKALGTARILALSLVKCKITVGEKFDPSLFDLNNTYLLFPSEDAIAATDICQDPSLGIDNNSQFILLDGSWKKAYKLLMSNRFLQELPKIAINVSEKSRYRIRKSPREDGLKPLLDSFDYMIDYQISCMPAGIYQHNYLNKDKG